jgi:hypothetical protein
MVLQKQDNIQNSQEDKHTHTHTQCVHYRNCTSLQRQQRALFFEQISSEMHYNEPGKVQQITWLTFSKQMQE